MQPIIDLPLAEITVHLVVDTCQKCIRQSLDGNAESGVCFQIQADGLSVYRVRRRVSVRCNQHRIAFSFRHGHGSRRVAVQLDKPRTLQEISLVGKRCRKFGILEEQTLVVAVHIEGKARGISVVLGFVFVYSAMIELGVHLVVVERTAIINIERTIIVHRFRMPPLVKTCREGDALVGFKEISRFCFVVQIVCAEIEREFLLLPFKCFGEIEKFCVHISLEPCRYIISSLASLHFDKTAGKVAVLHGRDTAYDGNFLYVIG